MTDEQSRCRSKQRWLLATGLATLLITLPSFLAAPAAAQQITGTPGTPSATMTLDGKQLPPEPPKFGGDIKEDRERLQALLATVRRAAQGRTKRAADHDR